MLKQRRIESKKARDSARGELCTLNIAGVCNYDSATTILAHLPDDSGTGKGAGKSDDVGCAVYACNLCHDVIDGRLDPSVYGARSDEYYDRKNWYNERALKRTIRRMLDNGVIKL